MKPLCCVLITLISFAAAAPAWAGQLGDEALPLKLERWVKGGPLELEDGRGKNVYVVEFWATWCTPCIVTAPHLSEIQKKYRDKGVVVVGVSIDEDSKRKTRKDVEPFVKKMGGKMDYAIALDTDDLATWAAYKEAFLLEGIPTAFIIDKQGKTLWVGHPQQIEQPLDDILAGKYDLAAARKADDERRKVAQKRADAMKTVRAYFERVTSSDDPEGAEAFGLLVLMSLNNDPNLLNVLAWDILTREDVKFRDLKLALRAAKAAYDGTEGKNAAIVDTYARALFDTGRIELAIEHQKKAVELAHDDQMRKELEETLRQYEKAAG